MTDKPTIGRIVHYRPTLSQEGVGGDFHIAAIITMTADEWTPGYRNPDGTWVETVGISQPKPNTVHLHVFAPPVAEGQPAWAGLVDVADVPYGEPKADTPISAPGIWYWPARV